MKSTIKIKLGQIEKGDELKKIDEKAEDQEVLHRTGNLDEEADGIKTFKEAPKSQKKATQDQHLVRLKELNEVTTDLAADDNVVKLSNVNQTIDGVKTFQKAPKSQVDAASSSDLVRYGQYTTDLMAKADNNGVVHNTGDEEVDGIKTFKKTPKSDLDAVANADLVRKGQMDTKLSGKVNSEAGKGLSSNDFTTTDKQNATKGAEAESWGDHSTAGYAQDDDVVKISDKGVPDGVAELDQEGKVPVSQLPSFVSDVLEFDTENDFPATGESAVIYVAKDTNKTYRWSGTGYVVIGDGELSLGETSSTAYRGDRGKKAYDHSQKTSGNPHEVTKADVGLSDADNTSDADKPISTDQQNLFDDKVDKEAGKSLIDDDKIDKIDGIEEDAQKNVQADYAELDTELDSFIKNKESYIDVDDEFDFFEGGFQKFSLSNDLHKLLSVEVNGQGLVRSQWNEWHNMIEILDELSDGDSIKISYQTPTDYERIHGFRFDVTVPAPEVERIGNPDMETELPIQNGMKGCLLRDNGQVSYWLKYDDWTKKEDDQHSYLDGADGQVMVRVPRYWIKDTQKGDIRTIIFSDEPFEGAEEIPEMFIGAYKAARDRSDNLLCSIVNGKPPYRGGNNQSAWDNENDFKSQLSKPATASSRTDFRTYAKNRGADWHIVDIVAHTSIAWLITYEFGTRDHQSAIYDGPVDIDSAKWDEFNSRYPLFKCGLSNSLGNSTGKVVLDLSGQDLGVSETGVFRYRGIENWWGDIWEWMSGVNVIDNKYYVTKGKLESDDDSEGYQLVGDRPTENGYIQEMHSGTVLPKTNTGSSSTYYADYIHANDATTIRGLFRSFHANGRSAAGSFCLNSTSAPSTATAHRGSRLCFSKR